MENQELLKIFFSGELDKFAEEWLKSDHGNLITLATEDADDWVDEQCEGIGEWLLTAGAEALPQQKRLILTDKIRDLACDYDICIDELNNKFIWQDEAALAVLHMVQKGRKDIWGRNQTIVEIVTHKDNIDKKCNDCEVQATAVYVEQRGMDGPDGWVCKNCSEEYSSCDDCGDVFHNENLHWNENRGCNYCDRCAPSELDGADYSLKIPRTPSNPRHVGFELESCFSKPKSWIEPESEYLHRVYDDSSIECESGDTTAEVCVQPTNDFVALKKVLDAMQEAGSYVNHTCGGHIHADARDIADWFYQDATFDRNQKKIFLCKMFSPIQPLMFALARPERITNTYCKWTLRNGTNCDDRYRAMNVCALEKGTLEFRLFSGSLNFDELKLRGQICSATIQKMSEMVKSYGTDRNNAFVQMQLQFDGAVEFGGRPEAQEWLKTHPLKVKEYIQATIKYLGLSEADAELANTLYKKYWR